MLAKLFQNPKPRVSSVYCHELTLTEAKSDLLMNSNSAAAETVVARFPAPTALGNSKQEIASSPIRVALESL
jgi:hypothetical protein